MAIVLDSTVATNTANSYVSVAEADSYFLDSVSSTKAASWAALTANQKATVLVQANRVIETARFTIKVTRADYQLRYNRLTGTVIDVSFLWRKPIKWYFYQKLQFPRNLDVNPDGTNFIPDPIKEAQMEQAMYLINYDETAVANRLQGITLDSLGVGRDQVRLSQEYAMGGNAWAPLAFEFAKPFMLKNAQFRRA